MKPFEHVALILISVAFVYVFSASTSPRYKVDAIGASERVSAVRDGCEKFTNEATQ